MPKLLLITYTVDRPGRVRVVVYDVLGRRVATLADSRKTPGTYTVIWNGRTAAGKEAASGIYFYRLNAPGDRRLIKKMMLVR